MKLAEFDLNAKDTLGDILSLRFVGSYPADKDKHQQVRAFLSREDVSLEDKLKIHRHLNKGRK